MVTACSTALFNAVNSAPYVEVCTEFCLLDSHSMGVLPTKIIIPVIDLPVTLSCP